MPHGEKHRRAVEETRQIQEATLLSRAGSARASVRESTRRTDARRPSCAALSRKHPAWDWLEQQRGIGHLLAARTASGSISPAAHTPSSFWAYYAGWHRARHRLPFRGLRPQSRPVSHRIPVECHASRAQGRRMQRRAVASSRSAIDARRAPHSAGGRMTYDAQRGKSCYLLTASHSSPKRLSLLLRRRA